MLKEETNPKIEFVRIIEHGKKAVTVYESPLEKYLNAVLITEGGFEAQRCVPLKEMVKIREFPTTEKIGDDLK
jgi:hypothetical protein